MEQGSRATLSRGARVRNSADFKRAFQHSQRADGSLFTVLVVQRSAAGLARLGLVVSRRVGGAVARNRAKRLLREAFRRQPSSASVDIVLLAKPALPRADPNDVLRAYGEQLGRALRRLARPRRPSSAAGDRRV